jgi:hypothetical protein
MLNILPPNILMAQVPLEDGKLVESSLFNSPSSSNIRLLAMSVQLRINNLQERKSGTKTIARHLLRSIEVPDSPGAVGPVCEALQPDGRPCKVALTTTVGSPWCPPHHHEWTDLNARWTKAQKETDKLAVISSETAKQKVLKLRLSVELRRQIRDRFYPLGGDMQDYIKWIGKLETDVRQLADSLLSTDLSQCVSTSSNIRTQCKTSIADQHQRHPQPAHLIQTPSTSRKSWFSNLLWIRKYLSTPCMECLTMVSDRLVD